jgi:choloylglycine hydrolase
VFLTIFQPTAQACSFIQVVAKDGTLITGRTMEFGVDTKPCGVVTPRGREFISPAPAGFRGMTWKTKYGSVAAFSFGDNTMAVDGMNEKGLVVSGLWFENDMKWNDPAESGDKPVLSHAMLISWLLGNFETTAEVTHAVKSAVVFGQPIPQMGGAVPALHFAAQDASGGSIVIEWTQGKVNVYENPLGVMTNAPNSLI